MGPCGAACDARPTGHFDPFGRKGSNSYQFLQFWADPEQEPMAVAPTFRRRRDGLHSGDEAPSDQPFATGIDAGDRSAAYQAQHVAARSTVQQVA